MAGIGTSSFILIALVALFLFGTRRLPELGRAVGSTLREFKQATKTIFEESPEKTTPNQKVPE